MTTIPSVSFHLNAYGRDYIVIFTCVLRLFHMCWTPLAFYLTSHNQLIQGLINNNDNNNDYC